MRKFWIELMKFNPSRNLKGSTNKVNIFYIEWLKHQRRDDYWKHGSVCEDYSKIKAATLAIGGWGDAYKNTVSHLVENLSCPVKGIVGPWVHKYPHFAVPGPRIDFLHEALRWWDQRRSVEPLEVIPLVEQVAILTEFGEYAEAADRIDQIFGEGMESPDPRSMMRLRTLSEQIKRAASKNDDFFRPQDPDNDGWIRIKAFSGRKPTTETYWLFFFVMPLIWIEAILINRIIPATGISTMVLGFMIIFASFMIGSRWVKTHVHRLNRPAHELTRAINSELTSGLVCIPENIRDSKLYSTLRDRRAIAAMSRHDKIVDNAEKMGRKWKITLPKWFVHSGNEEE